MAPCPANFGWEGGALPVLVGRSARRIPSKGCRLIKLSIDRSIKSELGQYTDLAVQLSVHVGSRLLEEGETERKEGRNSYSDAFMDVRDGVWWHHVVHDR